MWRRRFLGLVAPGWYKVTPLALRWKAQKMSKLTGPGSSSRRGPPSDEKGGEQQALRRGEDTPPYLPEQLLVMVFDTWQ